MNNFTQSIEKLASREDLARWRPLMVTHIRRIHSEVADLIHHDRVPAGNAEVQRRVAVAAANMAEVDLVVHAEPGYPANNVGADAMAGYLTRLKIVEFQRNKKEKATNKNIAALGEIISFIADNVLARIEMLPAWTEAVTSHNLSAAWAAIPVALEQVGGTKSMATVRSYAEFAAIRQGGEESIGSYISRFNKLRLESKQSGGVELAENLLGYGFVSSLNPKFALFVNLLAFKTPMLQTLVEAQGLALDWENSHPSEVVPVAQVAAIAKDVQTAVATKGVQIAAVAKDVKKREFSPEQWAMSEQQKDEHRLRRAKMRRNRRRTPVGAAASTHLAVTAAQNDEDMY